MGKKGREKVTVFTRQKERPNELRVDNGVLFCIFCDHSIEWNRKSTVDSHFNSKSHLTNKNLYEKNLRTNRQQTLHSSLSASENKKAVIEDLIRAFAGADIPLEKINVLLPFFKKYLHEGGAIPQAATLRQLYLPRVFLQHHEDLVLIFKEKPITIITDEATDDCSRSVVNTLFSYKNHTKLVSVDFLLQVNNATIGQNCVNTITTFQIPLSSPRIFVTDSAAYMKKSFREVLKPLMPQLIHIPCCAHIINLIG